MYQPIVLLIGMRYLRGQTSNVFGQFVSWLSTIGIIIGVTALVLVLSVMNGFERDLKNNILRLIPQVLITTKQGSLNPNEISASNIQGTKGVTNIVPFITADVVLQSAHHIVVAVMFGIDTHHHEPLMKFLFNVSKDVLQNKKYNLILGRRLAEKLGVSKGDTIRLIVPSVSQFTPLGQTPSQRLCNVSGIFIAKSEVDEYQFLLNQQDASRLMHYTPGNITGWRLFLEHPLAVDRLKKQIKLPVGTVWQDWRSSKGELFQAVLMEKNMMGLLLSLIIGVAAFNIITSLGLLIMEKRGEVAVLQTLGLNRGKIILVFIIQGSSKGIIGAFFGTIIGVWITSHFTSIAEILGFPIAWRSLPVVIEPLQVTLIAISTILVALLSTLYPSYRAAVAHPIEELRYV